MRKLVNRCKHQFKTNKARSFRDSVSPFKFYALFISSHFVERLSWTLSKLFSLRSVRDTQRERIGKRLTIPFSAFSYRFMALGYLCELTLCDLFGKGS